MTDENLNVDFHDVYRKLSKQIDEYSENGSGWVLNKIMLVDIGMLYVYFFNCLLNTSLFS